MNNIKARCIISFGNEPLEPCRNSICIGFYNGFKICKNLIIDIPVLSREKQIEICRKYCELDSQYCRDIGAYPCKVAIDDYIINERKKEIDEKANI